MCERERERERERESFIRKLDVSAKLVKHRANAQATSERPTRGSEVCVFT